MVQNLVPLNKRTKILHYPMSDVAKVKLGLGRAAYISKIDLKAGFFNVPLAESSRRYTAFSCAAGRFFWRRMTMGMCNAPAHFQWVMEDVLRGQPTDPKLMTSILLDDVTIAEDDVDRNVDDAAEAIGRLCRAGAMVGLYKGVVGASEAEFMGERWYSGGYFRPPSGKAAALLQLGDDALANMPRAQLYGMLSYWRQFIPDFSAKTSKVRKLLSQDAGEWTPAHTQEVRKVLQELLEGAPCINFDPQAPVLLETHTGPKGLGAICLQEDPASSRWLPVASFSRTLEGMDTTHSPILLELMAIQEGLHKMVQVVIFAADLRLAVTPALMALQKAKAKLHPDLLWRLCDI